MMPVETYEGTRRQVDQTTVSSCFHALDEKPIRNSFCLSGAGVSYFQLKAHFGFLTIALN